MRRHIVLTALVLVMLAGCRKSEDEADEYVPPVETPEQKAVKEAARVERSKLSRAPTLELLSVQIGKTTYTEVKSRAGKLGLTCKDTSMKTLMKQIAEKRRKKAEEAGTDGKSGASWKKKKKRKAPPQFRLSCENTPAEKLGDRKRAPITGRWLFVFDHETIPLRHVSFRRTHQNLVNAYADIESSVRYLTKRFGKPSTDGGLPPRNKSGVGTVPKFKPFNYRWEFSDASVRLEGLRLGENSVSVMEAIEVPVELPTDK